MPPASCLLPLASYHVLLYRLGIWYFKTELETLAFAISQPQQFAAISATLAELRAEAEPSVAAAQVSSTSFTLANPAP